jgi:hypothetical protein
MTKSTVVFRLCLQNLETCLEARYRSSDLIHQEDPDPHNFWASIFRNLEIQLKNTENLKNQSMLCFAKTTKEKFRRLLINSSATTTVKFFERQSSTLNKEIHPLIITVLTRSSLSSLRVSGSGTEPSRRKFRMLPKCFPLLAKTTSAVFTSYFFDRIILSTTEGAMIVPRIQASNNFNASVYFIL